MIYIRLDLIVWIDLLYITVQTCIYIYKMYVQWRLNLGKFLFVWAANFWVLVGWVTVITFVPNKSGKGESSLLQFLHLISSESMLLWHLFLHGNHHLVFENGVNPLNFASPFKPLFTHTSNNISLVCWCEHLGLWVRFLYEKKVLHFRWPS